MQDGGWKQDIAIYSRWTLTLLVHAQCTGTGRKRRKALR